ncbi:hypothetical protein TNCT_486191 [Trichonephila clavata]|uniref:Uncharacterized protein n=1 Tax=Trichonephila clavata TaxID=2740835 RepID=A0A8X6J4S8_TRICU|nr:hypothetical protein TNCT_486191 [Trichonephila clavata]
MHVLSVPLCILSLQIIDLGKITAQRILSMNDGIFKVMGIEPVPRTLIIQALSEEVSGLITEDYLILSSTAHRNGFLLK